MIIAGILNPVPWIDLVYAQNMYKYQPWAIVAAIEKSVVEYYNSHNKTLAPDFNAYVPGMLKNLDPSMTFTPTHINFAVNNIMSNPEFVGVYNWNTLYWILVDTLYDRIFPKIEGTIWRPPIYYERGPLVITESQYKEAAALSNSPKYLLIYAITQIIRNIRSQWKAEPIISDVLDGVLRMIPADVIFTEAEIEFATYLININPETELIYSYQMWYEALSGALSGRIYTPYTPPVEIPITSEPVVPVIEDRLFETAEQVAIEKQKEKKELLLAGGLAAAIIRLFFW